MPSFSPSNEQKPPAYPFNALPMSKSTHTERQFCSCAKSLCAFCKTAVDVIWSGTSVPLSRYRCPTVEARFTERPKGGQELS